MTHIHTMPAPAGARRQAAGHLGGNSCIAGMARVSSAQLLQGGGAPRAAAPLVLMVMPMTATATLGLGIQPLMRIMICQGEARVATWTRRQGVPRRSGIREHPLGRAQARRRRVGRALRAALRLLLSAAGRVPAHLKGPPLTADHDHTRHRKPEGHGRAGRPLAAWLAVASGQWAGMRGAGRAVTHGCKTQPSCSHGVLLSGAKCTPKISGPAAERV